MGDIFQLKKLVTKNIKNIYRVNDRFYGSICTLEVLISVFSKMVHFLLFLNKFFPSTKLYLHSKFFPVYPLFWLTSPAETSGPGDRLGARPCSRPWAGPSSSVPAGLLSVGCCLAPRAAGLAGACCRADWPAVGRTARAAAAPAWAAAAAQVWLPRGR